MNYWILAHRSTTITLRAALLAADQRRHLPARSALLERMPAQACARDRGGAAKPACCARVHLALIDNSEDRAIADGVIELGKARFADSGVHVTYLHGHANIGYGVAHNLVLHGTGADYHLVLNPDVELATDALANGVRWLDAHPDVGALAPARRRGRWHARFTCASATRRSSTCSCAASRRAFLRALFRAAARIATRCATSSTASRRRVIGMPVMSGAFMLVKRDAIDRTGGFDPKFFLYFEDFDWSVRLTASRRPRTCRRFEIVHHGGDAARKGLRHIGWFVRSGIAVLPQARLEVVLRCLVRHRRRRLHRPRGRAAAPARGPRRARSRARDAGRHGRTSPSHGGRRPRAMRRTPRMRSAMRDARAVVHLAGRAHRAAAIRARSAARRVNVDVTARLARAAAARRCRRISSSRARSR